MWRTGPRCRCGRLASTLTGAASTQPGPTAEPTRVLLTGASGFVGLNLISGLVSSGCRVTAVARNINDDYLAAAGAGGVVKAFRADIRDTAAVSQAIHDAVPDVLIHAAGVTPLGEQLELEEFEAAVSINVAGTASVLEAARDTGVPRLVYVSSATIYGWRRTLRPLRESDIARPSSTYGVTKYSAELLWKRHGELSRRDHRVVRISSPFGPWERPTDSRPLVSPLPRWCQAAVQGGRIEEPTNVARDFTYIDDTVDGVIAVALAPTTRRRTYNVSTGELYWYSDVLRYLKEAFPAFTYTVGPASTGDDARLPQRGPLSLDRISRDLGWVPKVSLRDGLAKYAKWLRQTS